MCVRCWRINLRLWFNTRFSVAVPNPALNPPSVLTRFVAHVILLRLFFPNPNPRHYNSIKWIFRDIYGLCPCLCLPVHLMHIILLHTVFAVLLFTILFLSFSMTCSLSLCVQYNLRKMAGSNFRGFLSARAFLYIFNLIILCQREKRGARNGPEKHREEPVRRKNVQLQLQFV